MMVPANAQEFLAVARPALEHGDPQLVAEAFAQRWAPAELAPLVQHPDVIVRRVAAMALGLVGDLSVAGPLARALHDIDDQVYQYAHDSLWSIWFRASRPCAAQPFEAGIAHMEAGRYTAATQSFTDAIEVDPDFAEAYNQRAMARFFRSRHIAAVRDCRRTLACVPCHFGAWCGMGHCYAEMGDLKHALRCYRKAVKINPRLHEIAETADQIKSRLKHINDSSGTHEFAIA